MTTATTGTNILEALRDSELLGRVLPDLTSWRAWLTNLTALFGLPMDDDQFELYKRHTGNKERPTKPYRRAWYIIGRRGGKSFMAALIATFLACFRSYEDVLAPGERGTVMVFAVDRRQARVVFGYINAILDAVPMLSRMVIGQTKETIELSNRVNIEVHTASYRSVRGYTIIAAVLDEVAFWPTEDSANPAEEIIAAITPGMSTVPDPLLLGISTGYARRGPLWEAFDKSWGKDTDEYVWRGDSLSMNPTIDQRIIEEAYEKDPASAAAEFGGEFRHDLESFVAQDVVSACVVPNRLELPPLPDHGYVGFVDAAGGSGADSMTLAICHRDTSRRAILDVIRERRPPFSPDEVTRDFASVLHDYRVRTVTGDRYAGEWPRERFREYGINYEVSDRTRSDLYRDFLPLLNSQRAELLDVKRLVNQLCSLERRTARSGKDSIDHAPNAHDDVSNACAGAIVHATSRFYREPGDYGFTGRGEGS